MNLLKKVSAGVLVSGLALTFSLSNASAAVPVTASISPANHTLTATSASVTKKLVWGGGAGNSYNVSYYDGKTTGFSDPYANYYSTNVSSSYSLGTLSTKKWNTSLRVSSVGGSATAYGSVTLKRQ